MRPLDLLKRYARREQLSPPDGICARVVKLSCWNCLFNSHFPATAAASPLSSCPLRLLKGFGETRGDGPQPPAVD